MQKNRPVEQQLLQVLQSRGINDPYPVRELAKLLNVDVRDIYKARTVLVENAVPVLASRDPKHNGLYIAQNQEELNQGIISYQNQQASMFVTLKNLERCDGDNWKNKLEEAAK